MKSPKFRLRSATIEDAPDILAIYQAGDDFALSGDRQKDLGLLDAMEWIESATPERPMLVVTVDNPIMVDGSVIEEQMPFGSRLEDVVIGWGALEPFYGLPSFDLAAEVSVYILPEWRGKGAGAAFIQHLSDHTDALNFSHLIAYIYARNTSSQQFFKKQGFEPWGILPKIASHQEYQEDVLLLGKMY